MEPMTHVQAASRVLIVDGDSLNAALLASALREERFEVRTFQGAESHGLSSWAELILLALDGGGECALEALLGRVPLIAYGGEMDDRIRAFELGADDVVKRPLSTREVALRIRAVLRRASRPLRRMALRHGDVIVRRSDRTLVVGTAKVVLTQVETRLVVALTRAAGGVCARARLLGEVWPESSLDERAVDTHIRRLREKLGPYADRIETVRGVGYRLRGSNA